jgi:Cu+-exporting ATPase
MLHSAGVCVAMLTGDNRTTAEAVARKLGIDEVEAEVLPEQTTQTVRRAPGAGQEGRDGRRWGK